MFEINDGFFSQTDVVILKESKTIIEKWKSAKCKSMFLQN
jgi:hypothetical protein